MGILHRAKTPEAGHLRCPGNHPSIGLGLVPAGIHSQMPRRFLRARRVGKGALSRSAIRGPLRPPEADLRRTLIQNPPGGEAARRSGRGLTSGSYRPRDRIVRARGGAASRRRARRVVLRLLASHYPRRRPGSPIVGAGCARACPAPPVRCPATLYPERLRPRPRGGPPRSGARRPRNSRTRSGRPSPD